MVERGEKRGEKHWALERKLWTFLAEISQYTGPALYLQPCLDSPHPNRFPVPCSAGFATLPTPGRHVHTCRNAAGWYLPTASLGDAGTCPARMRKTGPEDARDCGEPGKALGIPTCRQGASDNKYLLDSKGGQWGDNFVCFLVRTSGTAGKLLLPPRRSLPVLSARQTALTTGACREKELLSFPPSLDQTNPLTCCGKREEGSPNSRSFCDAGLGCCATQGSSGD